MGAECSAETMQPSAASGLSRASRPRRAITETRWRRDTASTGQSNGTGAAAGTAATAAPADAGNSRQRPRRRRPRSQCQPRRPSRRRATHPGQAGGNQVAAAAPAPLGDFTTAVRDVAQKVKPTVVQITNEQVQADQFGQATVPAGVGSGVIYDNQGHIITNNHVVEGAQQLLVALPDGRSFPGKLLGATRGPISPSSRSRATTCRSRSLGDSRQLQVGDWVVAIGNALGLPGGPTVTAGVVSALNRTVQEPGSDGGPGPFLFDVMQTERADQPRQLGWAADEPGGRGDRDQHAGGGAG